MNHSTWPFSFYSTSFAKSDRYLLIGTSFLYFFLPFTSPFHIRTLRPISYKAVIVVPVRVRYVVGVILVRREASKFFESPVRSRADLEVGAVRALGVSIREFGGDPRPPGSRWEKLSPYILQRVVVRRSTAWKNRWRSICIMLVPANRVVNRCNRRYVGVLASRRILALYLLQILWFLCCRTITYCRGCFQVPAVLLG